MIDKESNKVCRHYHVFGRVQGVWYRASTRDQARQLGLVGWVRNCEDGSVETVACGTPESLETFRSWLGDGPSGARVDRVEETEAPESPKDDDFHVRA